MPAADPGKSTGAAGRNGNHDGGDLPTAPRSNGNGPSRPATGDVQNGNPTAATAMGRGNGPTARPASGDEVRDQTSSRPTVLAGVQERSRVDLAIILAVALVAAAASYGHMLKVALIAGEPLLIARAFPITVDGLVLAALRYREPGRHWLKLGIAVSIAANVLAQFPEVAANAGPLISAWPPVALYGTHRLMQNHRAQTGRTTARQSIRIER